MDQISYFRDHPPRCVAGFAAVPTQLSGAKLDGHASLADLKIDSTRGSKISAPEHFNPAFALLCQCGGALHYVHGYRWASPGRRTTVVFLSPLTLECAQCGKVTDLIDTDAHGYDAELGHIVATVRGKGEKSVFECPKCGRQPLFVLARFEYSDDLFDRRFASFAGQQEDLFSWFSLLGTCPVCEKLLAVTDFECA